MRIMILYDTKFGNGRIAMESLRESLQAMGHVTDMVEVSERPHIDGEVDMLVLSAPTHHDAPSRPMIDYLRKHPLPEDLKVAMVVTHSVSVVRSLDRMAKERKGGVTVGNLALRVDDLEGPLEDGYLEKIRDFAEAIAS